tara:strand:- start:739 stop:1911 length:1173 start_codon:yes stop_codon:yes gene_type:complete
MIYTLTTTFICADQIVQWYDIIDNQDYLKYKNIHHSPQNDIQTPYNFFKKNVDSNFGLEFSTNDLLIVDLGYLHGESPTDNVLEEVEKNIKKLSDTLFKKIIVISKDLTPVDVYSNDKVEILSPNHVNYIEKKFNYYLLNASFSKIQNTSFELFKNFKYISRNKKSTLLMGGFKPHRTLLYNFVKKQNMLDDMYISYMCYNVDNLKDEGYHSHFFDKNIFDKNKVLNIISYEEFINLKKDLPIFLDGNMDEDNFNLLPPLPYITNSYVHIVECNLEGDNMLYTDEKTFRPFLTFSIPLFLGQRGLYQLLKNYGFDVFDDFFDIGKDDEADDIERMKSYFENIKKIHDMSYSDLQLFYIESHERILHNYNKLRELGNQQIEEFIKKINEYN